jgi:hypothetical protein
VNHQRLALWWFFKESKAAGVQLTDDLLTNGHEARVYPQHPEKVRGNR